MSFSSKQECYGCKNKVYFISSIEICYIGTHRNPWTRETMGDRTNMSGTDRTDDMANV